MQRSAALIYAITHASWWHVASLLSLTALIAPSMAGASTLIVDSAGSGQATGVQVGISLANPGDTVRVLSGTSAVYNEAVVIDKDITLECEGPDLVKIHNNGGDTITIAANRSVTIRGCTITGAGSGIKIHPGVNADIVSNVLWGNVKGISRLVPPTGTTLPIGTVVIRNNVVTSSSSKGIDLATPNNFNTNCATVGDTSKVVISNIVYSNAQCGISLCSAGGSLLVEYNDVIGNTPNYCDNAAAGVGALSVAPGFMNEAVGDFRLSSNSTLRNTGKPGYNDPDGTRNDRGAYGGPESAGFFPSPEGGPTIRTMSVFPSSVPKNGTITLEAAGQVVLP